MERLSGSIKWYSTDRGYGFIAARRVCGASGHLRAGEARNDRREGWQRAYPPRTSAVFWAQPRMPDNQQNPPRPRPAV